jgi:hypothetical protein
MKTAKLAMLTILAAFLLSLTPAYTSVGFAGGHHGHHGHHHGHHGHHHSHYYSSFAFFIDPFWVASLFYPPPVVYEPPVVYAPPTVVVTPPPAPVPQVNYEGLEKIRLKKQNLLDQLKSPDKPQRLAAVIELAGFSFDDRVKAELENILLSDPDPAMRIAAAHAFASVKNKGALPTLQKVRITDPEQSVRKAADSAIDKIKS